MCSSTILIKLRGPNRDWPHRTRYRRQSFIDAGFFDETQFAFPGNVVSYPVGCDVLIYLIRASLRISGHLKCELKMPATSSDTLQKRHEVIQDL